ncbi:hypothetical protein RHMOL_Rhmol07G0029200 [Rhododendron molle]|uniref:Uncharacterized protein n=1 Tax=Rhododendron molle TaxID=49168 RepID=A0ACC0MWK6_RHOML|nr:hypothetical protein RHMOL_Rhmol07G0029200 [Rhododendron molle]
MAFSYSRSKLPGNGSTPSTPQACSIFHYPNLERAARLRALSAARHCLFTESNDFSIAKQHCAKTSSLGQLVGSLAIMNLNWGAEWWNSVTRRMSPARYRHCPEYVVLMSSYSTSSLGGKSREKGGALGIQKIIRGSELKNALLLALHKVKLQVFRVLPFGPGGSDDSRPCLSVWKQLLQDPITLHRCSLFRPLFFYQLKRIPYSKRYHLLLAPSMGFDSLERDSGDAMLKKSKKQYKGYIVPPNNPQTIRVESILEEIVQAMQNGLRLPNRGKRCTRFDTEHLDGMKWEVVVVDTKDDDPDAGYDPQLMPQLYETSPDLPATHGIFASHPTVRKRVKKLKEPKVMEQAVAIYKEVTSGLGVRSFI